MNTPTNDASLDALRGLSIPSVLAGSAHALHAIGFYLQQNPVLLIVMLGSLVAVALGVCDSPAFLRVVRRGARYRLWCGETLLLTRRRYRTEMQDIVPSSGRDTKSHVLSGLGSDPRLRVVPSACP